MAYVKQTWADNAAPPNGVFNATRGNYMEQGIFDAAARADEAYDLAAAGGGGGAGAGYPVTTVASNEASATVKAMCNYVCDGVDDQVQINLALAAASRSADGFGGTGGGVVELIGPRFYVANNNSTTITMYPNTWLRGGGWNTIITPMWSSSTANRGAIELLNANTAHVRVSDLSIGRHNAVVSNGHGIYFVNDGNASTYNVMTGNDPFIVVQNVLFNLLTRSGLYVTGTTGGARETQVYECIAWSCGERGFYMDSSDCQVSDCRATGGGDFARFEIAGGNCKVSNSKAYFSGNRTGSNTQSDGFVLSSSRINITGCDAQDNGRWGFRFLGADCTATGCVADSNARANVNGGGFEIGSTGVYMGMNAYERGQTPASPQQRPVVFTGTPQVMFHGRTGIVGTLAGAAHVTGTPGANSHVRIMRHGTTIYSFD